MIGVLQCVIRNGTDFFFKRHFLCTLAYEAPAWAGFHLSRFASQPARLTNKEMPLRLWNDFFLKDRRDNEHKKLFFLGWQTISLFQPIQTLHSLLFTDKQLDTTINSTTICSNATNTFIHISGSTLLNPNTRVKVGSVCLTLGYCCCCWGSAGFLLKIEKFKASQKAGDFKNTARNCLQNVPVNWDGCWLDDVVLKSDLFRAIITYPMQCVCGVG